MLILPGEGRWECLETADSSRLVLKREMMSYVKSPYLCIVHSYLAGVCGDQQRAGRISIIRQALTNPGHVITNFWSKDHETLLLLSHHSTCIIGL